jgi:RNase adaptor protein for sRNA GlmZ degradation
MGIGILIMGESGSGKTTSIRNLKNAGIVNVYGKPLPFREKNDGLKIINANNSDTIIEILASAKTNIIVVDDFQGVLVTQFMARAKELGFQKFTEMALGYYNIIRKVQSLPENKRVYFLSHIEQDAQGKEKVKTLGKLLDEKITVEGLFTIVLKTHIKDGKYYFQTHNSGYDTVKSPIDMFQVDFIPNDINLVDTTICDFYGIKKEDK